MKYSKQNITFPTVHKLNSISCNELNMLSLYSPAFQCLASCAMPWAPTTTYYILTFPKRTESAQYSKQSKSLEIPKTLTLPHGSEECGCQNAAGLAGPSLHGGCPGSHKTLPLPIPQHLQCSVLSVTQNAPSYLAQRPQEPWGDRSRLMEWSRPLWEFWNCRASSSRMGLTGPSPSSSLLREARDTADRSTLRQESSRCCRFWQGFTGPQPSTTFHILHCCLPLFLLEINPWPELHPHRPTSILLLLFAIDFSLGR